MAGVFCLFFSSSPSCSFLRVRLLVNRQTEEAVAVKVIDTSQAKECAENVKKEVCIHKVCLWPSAQLAWLKAGVLPVVDWNKPKCALKLQINALNCCAKQINILFAELLLCMLIPHKNDFKANNSESHSLFTLLPEGGNWLKIQKKERERGGGLCKEKNVLILWTELRMSSVGKSLSKLMLFQAS